MPDKSRLSLSPLLSNFGFNTDRKGLGTATPTGRLSSLGGSFISLGNKQDSNDIDGNRFKAS
jgi:hypothetical protein